MTESDSPNNREHLDGQRLSLPEEPGVYLYHDSDGNVLYVGKAKNLKKRVNTYFTRALDARLHALVMRIADIEILLASSEREALVFEARLIQRHRPPFNVMLRDDKSYPYVVVTMADDYPRVMFTRDRKRIKGARYFGPYISARRVRRSLDLLNRIFPYRPCEGSQPGRQSGTPCLDYHIERCAAPCVGYISKADYRAIIEQVVDVLNNNPTRVRAALEQQMQVAARDLEFEKAARLRNRLNDLDEVVSLYAAESPGDGSFDVLGVAIGEDDSANVQLLQIRDSRLHDRRSRFMDHVAGLDPGQVLAQFALQQYEQGRPVPPQIVVQHGLLSGDDSQMLVDELSRVRGSQVAVREAQRGDKRRLAELAMRNAVHAVSYDTIRERTRLQRRQLALEELRDALDLESLPLRIECYDISNLQDEAAVASMVVFEDGRPHREHYRRFSMRHTGGQDDFAMMAEVIDRRFTYLSKEPTDPDESFDATPNLVIIDGGKGQLSSAVASLSRHGIERVAICSLAKQEELVFVPGQAQPIALEIDSPSMLLVQHVRNEAHRFAVTYHRKRRDKERRHDRGSILDHLEGVGDARRRALLNFFGSPAQVMTATLDEIEAVPGMPGKVARRIYDQLNRLGSGAKRAGSPLGVNVPGQMPEYPEPSKLESTPPRDDSTGEPIESND